MATASGEMTPLSRLEPILWLPVWEHLQNLCLVLLLLLLFFFNLSIQNVHHLLLPGVSQMCKYPPKSPIVLLGAYGPWAARRWQMYVFLHTCS